MTADHDRGGTIVPRSARGNARAFPPASRTRRPQFLTTHVDEDSYGFAVLVLRGQVGTCIIALDTSWGTNVVVKGLRFKSMSKLLLATYNGKGGVEKKAAGLNTARLMRCEV